MSIAYLPAAQLPLREVARPLADQFETVVQLTGPQAFAYNVPTHSLARAIALAPEAVYRRDELPARPGGYRIPADWSAALAGAQKLGLVAVHGPEVGLTPCAVRKRHPAPFGSRPAPRAPLPPHPGAPPPLLLPL